MLEDFRIAELKIFADVVQSGSLREVSRSHHLQPSQLSKLMRKMEESLGHTLLIRSAQGMSLTPEGEEFHKKILQILTVTDEVQGGGRSVPAKKAEVKIISIAGPTFVAGSLVSPILPALKKELGRLKLRLLTVAQDQMVEAGIRGFFDVAIHVNPIDWPRSWSSVLLGKFYSGLYAGANHSLPEQAKVSEIKSQSFVVPTYLTKNRFYYGNDGCPIPVRERMVTSEVSSADLAVGVIANSNQVAFIPELIARTAVANGQIKEIKVKEWGAVSVPLYLSVRSDRVTQQLQRILVRELKAQLIGDQD
jgi:DNA-binding transcriptional LysR family regulator